MKKPKAKADPTTTGIAGEFYALAQLSQRGYVASFTLANTKGIDILVLDRELDHFVKLEVKTTALEPARDYGLLTSTEPVYRWPLSEKHETITDRRLFYCFVALRGEPERPEMPLFYIVPSSVVARRVREEHAHWLSNRRTKPTTKPSTVRPFRIHPSDPDGFQDNWNSLLGEVAAPSTSEPIGPR
jgi:hypothetical protein